MTSHCVLVYSRCPEAGRVKTRLIPSLSANGAAEIHKACLRATWAKWASAVRGGLILVGTPDDRQKDFANLLGSEGRLRFWAQGDGNLGERLARGFERAFSEGFESVVAIGTDSPTLPTSEMLGACAALADHDVVLGPAEDGGYYLIGLSGFQKAIFDGVAWGSDTVLSTTLIAARQLNLSVILLRQWYDVDTPADVSRLQDELRAVADPCPAERELLESLDAVTESSNQAG